MDYNQALNNTTAELTPNPWDYTDTTGTTLTAIPAGLRESTGNAEILVRITASHTLATEIGITTTDMPNLLHALNTHTAVDVTTTLDGSLTTTPHADGSTIVTITEVDYDNDRTPTTTSIRLPGKQRFPFMSALQRAADVARDWED